MNPEFRHALYYKSSDGEPNFAYMTMWIVKNFSMRSSKQVCDMAEKIYPWLAKENKSSIKKYCHSYCKIENGFLVCDYDYLFKNRFDNRIENNRMVISHIAGSQLQR